MTKFNANAYAAQLNTQVNNNVSSALYLSAFTLKVQLETGLALTTAGAWSALGNKGKPTKKDKTAYTRANNLQRRAAKTADVLSKLSVNPAMRPASFAGLCDWVNGLDFSQPLSEAQHDAINELAKPFSVLVSDGASFYEYMLHAVGAAQADGSSETTEDGEGSSETTEDGEGVDTSDKVADLQRQKEFARSVIEAASNNEVLAATIDKLAGMEDPQLIIATILTDWMADRNSLLKRLDSAELAAEKAEKKAEQLAQSADSLRTTKALKTALKTA